MPSKTSCASGQSMLIKSHPDGHLGAIEVFFKQIKQTLQICDLLGHSKQAIRWQLWSTLLLYELLRFQAWCSGCPHSFARLFTMIRSVAWDRFNLSDTLQFYGAVGDKR